MEQAQQEEAKDELAAPLRQPGAPAGGWEDVQMDGEEQKNDAPVEEEKQAE